MIEHARSSPRLEYSKINIEQPPITIEIYKAPDVQMTSVVSTDLEFDYDSLRGGVYDEYPDHKPFFHDLGQRLERVLNGEESIEDYEDYLDNLDPDMEDIVFKENPNLHASPLVYMRRAYEAERNYPKK